MKKLILLLISFLLVAGIVNALSISKTMYLLEESLFYVSAFNNGDEDLENVRIRVFIPDADLLYMSVNFDLDKGTREGRFIIMEDPLPQGEFLVRITASNDHNRAVKHIFIMG